MADTVAVAEESHVLPRKEMAKIIAASSMGTMIEWYDFYIFGSLSTVIASKFYQTGTPIGDMIAWLAAFAVGFFVRPFGAVVFGRVGDVIGRKYTFLVTMTIMGLCTFGVGVLPTIDKIGPIAGIILIVLRVLQGLALGGEYGGAATYVAEHAPHGKRGYYTSFIQITATAGLFLSLLVIQAARTALGAQQFDAWGWRIPFIVSILLVIVSIYIRYSMRESPLFAKLKESGSVSKNPIVESFGNKENLRWVLLALFGATMGQGVVWYTGQFYSLFYLQKVFGVDLVAANYIIGAALLLATPLFVYFGKLSDKIGRKPIMLGGMALAVLTYYPIYNVMARYAPSFPTDPGVVSTLAVKSQVMGWFGHAGYNPWILGLCVFIQVVYVTMVYGPIASFLVELFPTKIRYTSMSLPYHIGNGVFGGLVPIIGLSIIQKTGNGFAGLWYPMAIAAICFVIGWKYVRETKDIDIHAGESMADSASRVTPQPVPVLEPDAVAPMAATLDGAGELEPDAV